MRKYVYYVTAVLFLVAFVTTFNYGGCVSLGNDAVSGSSGAPSQVALPNPFNGATNISISQLLNWAPASDATSYDVYFGTTSPGVFQGNQTGTIYNPGTLSYNTTYYWWIDSRNSIGITTGNFWSFTTTSGGVNLPDQVTSPAPVDGATNVITTTQLSWASASGATSYDIYFGATSPGTLKGNQSGTSYNPGTLSYSTAYYWRIDSKNSTGTTTGNVWSFTATSSGPDQVTSPTPVNGATNVITTTQLSWASASGATGYDVYFGTTSPGTSKGNQTGITYNPGTLSNSTTYYWRIDSKNSSGTTSGDIWSFTTVISSVWSWSTNASMPVTRSARAPSASINGIIYVAGGHDGSVMRNEVFAYNTAADSWAAKASMPGPRYHGNGAGIINGRLYVAGGWTTSPPYPNTNLWEYDPVADSWSSKADMPFLSAGGANGVINGKLYVTTPDNGYSGYYNFLHVWDPANNTWTQLANSAIAHDSPAYGVINGKFYVVGGIDGSGNRTARLETYDPANNTWSTLAPMPTARASAAGAVIDGKLIVAGGSIAGEIITGVVEIYDPLSNTWSTGTPMLTARSAMSSAVVNNVAFFIGGTSIIGATNVVESLR
ncbi:MAG: kelch repeat-containing protein [Planctomycetota bacterium]